MQGVHLRKYGTQARVDFELYEIDGVDFRVDAAHASGDTKVMKDEGAEANTTYGFVDEGTGYSILISSGEMTAARIVIYIVDQTATKAWLDKCIVIETYGHASAMHAMDFDDAVRGGMTALPNAAADAAGGLVISDAGGLDVDTKLANTNEVTAARMGALTDWINGGRLDLLLDALLARLTAARAGYLDNINNHTAQTGDNYARLGAPAGASIAADLASTLAAIQGVSNVTRLSVAVPKYLDRPAAGNKSVKIEIALKDADGNMEDPDSSVLAVQLANSGGTDRSALLYKEYALTNALDAAAGTFAGYVVLERSAEGLYFAYVKIASDATEEELLLKFGWEEGSTALYEHRATQVVDNANDLGVLLTRLSAARAGYLDNINGHTAQTGDNYARLGSPAGASMAADVAANLTAVGNLNDPTAAAIKTALEADGSKLDHLWEMTEDDAGVRRYTTNALEQAPSGTGGDATASAQADIAVQLDKTLGAIAGKKIRSVDGATLDLHLYSDDSKYATRTYDSGTRTWTKAEV